MNATLLDCHSVPTVWGTLPGVQNGKGLECELNYAYEINSLMGNVYCVGLYLAYDIHACRVT